MKMVRGLLLLIIFILILSSCHFPPGNPSDSQASASLETDNRLSPFTQFENLEASEGIGINSEQVDNVFRSYGIYDNIVEKITENLYYESNHTDVSISGYTIGNKKVAVMLVKKGHLYIYVMFSNGCNQWTTDGFAYHNERFEPEYRIEQSSDGTKYWLVVRYESNHGTGLQIYDEFWYHPDGSVAAQYPLEGSTEFFPQIIEPSAYANFSTYAQYDGHSTISLSYTISFVYGYKDRYPNHNDVYKFKSDYRPVIREYWEYDLERQELQFISCSPALPDSFSTMQHETSAAFGILQGYIDFYRMVLEDKKITTLEEWEKAMSIPDLSY